MSESLKVLNFVENRCGVSYEVADPASEQLRADRSVEFLPSKPEEEQSKEKFSLQRLIERLDLAENRRKQILERRTKRLTLKRQRYRHFIHPSASPDSYILEKEDDENSEDQHCEYEKKRSSIAFDILLDDDRIENKRLEGFQTAKIKHQQRRQLTVEDIENKLRIAETRRAKYEECRLQKIKYRRNAVRSIARNVELLMELRSSYAQFEAAKNKHSLSRSEGVSHCASFYQTDKNGDFGIIPLKVTQPKAKGCYLSYSIEFDEVRASKPVSPLLTSPNRMSPVPRSITKEELEAKLVNAEQRRKRRLVERQRRTAASREALLSMANKIDIIMDQQNPSFDYLVKQNALFGHRLSGREIRDMAAEVAEGFETITQRYKTDIEQAHTLGPLDDHQLNTK